MTFKAEIAAEADRVFSLLSELRDYDDWLSKSATFKGTSSISPGPIEVGTTYVEEAPMCVRRGRVTRFDKPERLDFHQPMTMRPSIFGMIDIHVHYELSMLGDITEVVRTVELGSRGLIRYLMPLISRAFLSENRRILAQLKAAAEAAS